ncbi:MAG: PF20097 family protein [Phycisphaerales bacterium]
MAHRPTCLVCQQEMVLGFMTDQGHGAAVNLPRWCEGTPESGHILFGGGEVKHAQHAKGLPVVAYRCPQCEALRLYAPSDDKS